MPGISAPTAHNLRSGGLLLASGDVGNADTRSREAPGHRIRGSESSLKILFKLPRSKAEILYAAIAPEAADIPSRRAAVNLKLEDEALILEIKARDLVALRAALNSFLRFIDASLNVIDFVSSEAR